MPPDSWLRRLAVSCLLLGCLPVWSLADDAPRMYEELCQSSECLLDNIFDEEEAPPLSLVQMKASRIQALRAASDSTVPPRSPKVGMQAVNGDVVRSPVSPADALDIGNLARLDAKSRHYLFHNISSTLRERGQIAVLAVGSIVFAALVITSFSKSRQVKTMLQVQARVDHFVTPSKLLTTKREAAKTLPVGEAPEDGATASSPGHEDRWKPTRSNADSPLELREVSFAPLDPAFVLGLCETWYAVCVEPMVMCDGAFDILRIAGYPKLHGAVRHQDGVRVLEITCSSLPAKQGQILASVAAEEAAAGQTHGLRVSGLGGEMLGHIRLDADGRHVLIRGRETVMSVAIEAGKQLAVRGVEARKPLAQASWCEQIDNFSGAGHLAVRINPNVDTILVLACTLGLTILGGDKNLMRFTRPADGGAE